MAAALPAAGATLPPAVRGAGVDVALPPRLAFAVALVAVAAAAVVATTGSAATGDARLTP